MQRVIRRILRPVAGTLVVPFALLFPLMCATGQAMTQEEKACCAAMEHECGPVAEHDCCSIEAAHVDQVAPAMKVTLSAPATLVIAGGVAPELAGISAGVSFSAPADHVDRPGSTRMYLLVSALLI